MVWTNWVVAAEVALPPAAWPSILAPGDGNWVTTDDGLVMSAAGSLRVVVLDKDVRRTMGAVPWKPGGHRRRLERCRQPAGCQRGGRGPEPPLGCFEPAGNENLSPLAKLFGGL